MDSAELNERISALEEKVNLPYEAFGGKAIPYIGWYWRDVDFDSRVDPHGRYAFGVIPTGANESLKPLVGFMESNKWGYDYVFANQEQWDEIRRLVETALTSMTAKDFRAAHQAIQGLLDD